MGDEHRAVWLEGKRGQFDVFADGRLLFSKQAEGRYPDAAEIGALLDSS